MVWRVLGVLRVFAKVLGMLSGVASLGAFDGLRFLCIDLDL